MFGKIISHFAMQRSVSGNNALFQRLLRGAGIVAFLALFGAFLACMLFTGLMLLGYQLLTMNGMAADAAMIVMGIWLGIILIALLFYAYHQCNALKDLFKQITVPQNALMDQAHGLIGAFMDGLQGKHRR
jgi:hypothetical protein